MLAHIAEVDARKLYLPAGFSSMYAYCLGELGMSEDSACKRIRAARVSRQFAGILGAVNDGRLSLSAVVMLAPHLTSDGAPQLLAQASHKKNSEIELLLARRFPRSDVAENLSPVGSNARGTLRVAPGLLELGESSKLTNAQITKPASDPADQPVNSKALELSAARRIEARDPRPRVTPLSPQRFSLQVTLGQSAHDKLRHAQALLSHQVPMSDLAGVLERVLDLAIAQLEKRKLAAVSKPRASQKESNNARTIPARVRRAVWQRDGGKCAFVSSTGHRCSSREKLEFDHVEPVARGGHATVTGVRLLCREHNQHAAENALGVAFMKLKRQEARRSQEIRRYEREASWNQDGGVAHG
jgi:5-methylcytosine-specific restriction endonuclease McrA